MTAKTCMSRPALASRRLPGLPRRRGTGWPRGPGPLRRQVRRTKLCLPPRWRESPATVRRPTSRGVPHGQPEPVTLPVLTADHSPSIGNERQAAALAADVETGHLKNTPAAALEEAYPELPSRTNFCQQVRNRTAEWRRGGPTFSLLLVEVRCSSEGGGNQCRRASPACHANGEAGILSGHDPRNGRVGPLCYRLLCGAAVHGSPCRSGAGSRADLHRVLAMHFSRGRRRR